MNQPHVRHTQDARELAAYVRLLEAKVLEQANEILRLKRLLMDKPKGVGGN